MLHRHRDFEFLSKLVIDETENRHCLRQLRNEFAEGESEDLEISRYIQQQGLALAYFSLVREESAETVEQVVQSLPMIESLPTTQYLLGSYLVFDGQWQMGLKLLLKSLVQLRQANSYLATRTYAKALFETGYAYEALSDWDNARLYYRDALRLHQHIGDLSGIADSQFALGCVLASLGCFQQGLHEIVCARELYAQQDPSKLAETQDVYQAALNALEKQAIEV